MVIEIVDVHRSIGSSFDSDLAAGIIAGLSKPAGKRTLPSECFYDDVGLKMYDERMATYIQWYYPYVAERSIIETHCLDIVDSMTASTQSESAIIIEFGAGSLEKTAHVLLAFAESCLTSVIYYALDLQRNELKRTLDALTDKIGKRLQDKVILRGICGTYEDGIRLINNNELGSNLSTPIHILFLGGTIGNFTKGVGDADFLQSIPLNRSRGDTLLLGLDKAKNIEDIERAYGFAEASDWIMNGLKSSGNAIGQSDIFDLGKWSRYGKFNVELGRYEAGWTSKEDQILLIHGKNIHIQENETIIGIISNKYTEDEANAMIQNGKLESIKFWEDAKKGYRLCLLRKAAAVN